MVLKTQPVSPPTVTANPQVSWLLRHADPLNFGFLPPVSHPTTEPARCSPTTVALHPANPEVGSPRSTFESPWLCWGQPVSRHTVVTMVTGQTVAAVGVKQNTEQLTGIYYPNALRRSESAGRLLCLYTKQDVLTHVFVFDGSCTGYNVVFRHPPHKIFVCVCVCVYYS